MAIIDDEVEKDREEKKFLVLETIKKRCSPSSPIREFQSFGHALKQGDSLEIQIISGGLTNYSYKLYLSNTPDQAVYAKLSFQYALWNPDRVYYDIERTVNEFKAMKLMSDAAPGSVVEPILCVDVGGMSMKLLVTQWAFADEQWANQMIDGTIDERVIKNITSTLATLHSMDYHKFGPDFVPDFNTEVRSCVFTLFEILRDGLQDTFNSSDTKSRTVVLAQSFGEKYPNTMYENSLSNFDKRECLIHNDAHVFNILVEKKPDVQHLEQFGEFGTFSICDWEMALFGPIGRDIGIFFSFPIASALAYSIIGHKTVADNIIEVINMVWDEYSSALVSKSDKSEEFMCQTYRNCIAWCGWFSFVAYYCIGAHIDNLPVTENEQPKFKDSIGVVALQFLRWGFGEYDPHLSLDELRQKCMELLEKEVAFNIGVEKRPKRDRRSSVLRASGRRVSDTFLNFNPSRLSISGHGEVLRE